MRIGVTGGTGFIGSMLCEKLALEGNELVLFGRNRGQVKSVVPEAGFVEWNAENGMVEKSSLKGFDAFLHLAGEPIAKGRWTVRRKERIRKSRVLGTRDLVEGFRRCGEAPEVLISASAIGFYGNRGDEELE